LREIRPKNASLFPSASGALSDSEKLCNSCWAGTANSQNHKKEQNSLKNTSKKCRRGHFPA